MLRVNSIDYRGSICDGFGIRTVVFLQGCTRHCPGCHNPETWKTDAGRAVEPDELALEIDKMSPFKQVTISGGEPLLQPEDLEALLASLKALGFEITLYTSHQRGEVPAGILNLIDYLKTGEYIEALRTTVQPFVGSTNQRFEKVA